MTDWGLVSNVILRRTASVESQPQRVRRPPAAGGRAAWDQGEPSRATRWMEMLLSLATRKRANANS